jgi:hypothetical protein
MHVAGEGKYGTAPAAIGCFWDLPSCSATPSQFPSDPGGYCCGGVLPCVRSPATQTWLSGHRRRLLLYTVSQYYSCIYSSIPFLYTALYYRWPLRYRIPQFYSSKLKAARWHKKKKRKWFHLAKMVGGPRLSCANKAHVFPRCHGMLAWIASVQTTQQDINTW